MTQHDAAFFFRAWMAAPLRVASIVPSGRALARLITAEISPLTGRVLELGPGTGVFTRQLLARGVREEDLTLVEYGEEFARLVAEKFPRARTLRIDAAQIASALPADVRFGATVSGLPLLNMPNPKVAAILSGAFSVMEPGASLYQFTYGPSCPIRRSVLDELSLVSERTGGTFANFPPASVYRISRRA